MIEARIGAVVAQSGPRLGWRRRTSPARLAIVTGMSLLALSTIFPIVFMLTAALRTQDDWAVSKLGWPTLWSLVNFEHAWVDGHLSQYFVNSVIVTAGTVVLTVVVACLAGYSFGKVSWRARTSVYYFTLAWMALPPLLLMVPIYIEMSALGLINTYWSVILLYAALNTPFNVYLMTAFFRAVPDELLEAARVDGASVHAIFRRVAVPLALPAIATLVIFTALYAWNEFVFALLLLQRDDVRTVTVGVLQIQGRFFYDYPGLMAGMLIISLPVVGVYLIFQRYLVQAISAGALK
jgi:raffinose/stachyose/melibiose transport system permease protein